MSYTITRIETMFAFVVVDPKDNTEGIIATIAPNGTVQPMVGADMKRVESLRPYAQMVADAKGLTVKLVEFTTRTEREEIKPRSH